MLNYKIVRFIFVGILLVISSIGLLVAQEESDYSEAFFYKKKELNTGVFFYGNGEREELRTDFSKTFDEINFTSGAFQFKNSYWNFLDYKQDFLEFVFEVGPFYGAGNWMDSSFVENIQADQTQIGVRANVSVDYSSRYYYNERNYTIVEVGGWASYGWFNQNSDGNSIDSNSVVTVFDDSSNNSKFRYGFEAKAGWGWGRLNPMNNFMLAQHILEKYYAGRIFSENEVKIIAAEIYKIKYEREIVIGHNKESEAQLVGDFLNEKMLLTHPEDLKTDWELAEFMPRLQGSRIETGPFFKYFNREPDFVYGAYIQYKNAKYKTLKWNRNFSTSVNYNRYKKHDWILAEFKIGWSYFPDLKKQYDFGVKYVPGVELNNFSNVGEFNQAVVPYVGYFSQINSKSRVNFSFAYRISQDEKIMLSGPEFSLAVYWSRY